MEEIGFEVMKVFPSNYQNKIKNDGDMMLMIFLEIILILILIYAIINVGFVYKIIPFFILFLIPMIYLIVLLMNLYFEPLIIYNNGFIRGESTFKVKLFGRSKFINFSKVKDIRLLEGSSSWRRIIFLMRNEKEILQLVNNLNEYKIIIETYSKSK